MAHTPGPWTAHTYEPETGREHVVTAGKQGHIPVCRTGRWDTASASDARLIAEAPAMLDALRRIGAGGVEQMSPLVMRQLARAIIERIEKGE